MVVVREKDLPVRLARPLIDVDLRNLDPTSGGRSGAGNRLHHSSAPVPRAGTCRATPEPLLHPYLSSQFSSFFLHLTCTTACFPQKTTRGFITLLLIELLLTTDRIIMRVHFFLPFVVLPVLALAQVGIFQKFN